MSKCKETVNINGEIVQKYEVVKLNDNLSKQRFLFKTENGAKYFITAFGNQYIVMLSKFKDGDKVRLNVGKEISNFKGKEHINYYLNNILPLPNNLGSLFFERYIVFFNVNKIEHSLTFLEIEMVFNDFISQTGLSQIEFDTAIEYMVNKWRNRIYFHIEIKEKLFDYIMFCLKEIENDSLQK